MHNPIVSGCHYLEDKIVEEGGKGIAFLFSQNQWAGKTLLGIILILFVCACFILLRRLKNGDELSLWGMSLKSNKLTQELQGSLVKLNEDAKQKTQIIRHLSKIIFETSKAIQTSSYDDFLERKEAIYQYLLHGIGSILTKQKSNNHRVSIFVKDGETDSLKIHEGIGYSPDGKINLRLPIHDSAAGFVYKSSEKYTSGDVNSSGNKFKPHPKAKTSIKSLVCLPIICGNMVLGVLSIDDLGVCPTN